ncbi:MAG: glycosyltransferase [Planctomycetes bacterium]|nr:glycosyltransferase [Planctomycetota bacterium]
MTILHISTRLILGGSQENTVLSCEGQAERGHAVHLAYGPIYGPEGSLLQRAQDFRTHDGRRIACHEVPHLLREIDPRADRACLRELRALIEKIRPDIVHTHSSKAGILGRMAAWKVFSEPRASARADAGSPSTAPPSTEPPTPPRPAVIHTIHGPPFMPGTDLKTRLKNTAYTLAERHAAKRCHTIVSVADAMTAQFLARGIGRPEQFVTVRSGMETERFLKAAPGETRAAVREQLGIPKDAFVIGTVARLAEHKGHDTLLDALSNDLRTDPRWRLLWVGDGWWSDRLLARVRELGLEKQVIATGLVPQDRIPAMMRAMDVLCHPSEREGLPRTVPQALLCAVPVVASDCDGTPEVCLDPFTDADIPTSRMTGRLFPVGDADRLRAAVRWMHEHPDERQRLGEQGRALCARAFSAETMVAELEDVYRAALARADA